MSPTSFVSSLISPFMWSPFLLPCQPIPRCRPRPARAPRPSQNPSARGALCLNCSRSRCGRQGKRYRLKHTDSFGLGASPKLSAWFRGVQPAAPHAPGAHACGGCCKMQHPPLVRQAEGAAPPHASRLSRNRMSMVATWALVAGPWGLRSVAVVPPMMPCSTAQAMASDAQELTDAASV